MPDGDYDLETGEISAASPLSAHAWSQPCGELFAAMALAQADVENVEKGGLNPAFRSRYAKLGDVLDEVRPKFAARGIVITQMPINGTGSNIGVVTLFAHKSGQWLESRLYVAPTKFDAQGAGSVITYLRRYALMAMTGVAPDDDDDGNAAVASPAEARTAQERPPAARTTFNRPQAAPARSPAQEMAVLRYKELAQAIDHAEYAELTAIDVSLDDDPALLAIAETESKVLVEQLRGRIDARRKIMLGETG